MIVGNPWSGYIMLQCSEGSRLEDVPFLIYTERIGQATCAHDLTADTSKNKRFGRDCFDILVRDLIHKQLVFCCFGECIIMESPAFDTSVVSRSSEHFGKHCDIKVEQSQWQDILMCLAMESLFLCSSVAGWRPSHELEQFGSNKQYL